jgi:hypothetical protein
MMDMMAKPAEPSKFFHPATNIPAEHIEPADLTLSALSATVKMCKQQMLFEQVAEHPAAEFDRRTSAGEKLNLITGEYYRP